MAIRQLTRFDDERFRKISKPIIKFDQRLWDLLDDMRETLEKVNGYGCAAVHVGSLRRAVVVNDKDGVIELIDPIITESSNETQRVFEGSIAPGAAWGYVERPSSVTVSAVDRNGEPITLTVKDFLAATICHEIDHLDGILFTDKAVELITDPAKAMEISRKRAETNKQH
jgi:peptide deformylase